MRRPFFVVACLALLAGAASAGDTSETQIRALIPRSDTQIRALIPGEETQIRALIPRSDLADLDIRALIP